MPRTPRLELARQWRDRVCRFDHCGLTVAEFCRREGYSAALFYQWLGRLTHNRWRTQACTSPSQARLFDMQEEFCDGGKGGEGGGGRGTRTDSDSGHQFLTQDGSSLCTNRAFRGPLNVIKLTAKSVSPHCTRCGTLDAIGCGD